MNDKLKKENPLEYEILYRMETTRNWFRMFSGATDEMLLNEFKKRLKDNKNES